MSLTPQAQPMFDRLYAEDSAQRAAGVPSSQRTRNIDKASGKFLYLLTISLRARTVFEVGSSNGVSTIWIASGLIGTQGRVVGTEVLPDRAEEANINLAEAGLSQYAAVLTGDARETIQTVQHPIDFVFIDAEKNDYSDHFLAVFDKVRPAGVIVADNVVSHDCSAYQSMLRARDDVETVTLPLERGLEYTVKLEV
jgi:predicted O-methyltransferase YrrM